MSDLPAWAQPTYDPVAVQPMRDELLAVGFKELTTPEEVDETILREDDKTVLVVFNSVCGCAAGSARPGICEALQHTTIPDILATSFAGQDKMAVQHLRDTHLGQFPPSSPSMALFKNGEVIFILPRHQIEGRMAGEIAEILRQVFDKFCAAEGPSITPEQYGELVHARMCGSKIPRFDG